MRLQKAIQSVASVGVRVFFSAIDVFFLISDFDTDREQLLTLRSKLRTVCLIGNTLLFKMIQS